MFKCQFLGQKVKRKGAHGLECATSKLKDAVRCGQDLGKPKIAKKQGSAKFLLIL